MLNVPHPTRAPAMRLRLAAFLATVLLVAFLAGASAPSGAGGGENGAIEGFVVNEHYVGIQGALILLFAGGDLVAETTTAFMGTFALEEVTPGSYYLVAYAAGHEADGRGVTVQPGVVLEEFFLLPAITDPPVPPEPFVDGPYEWHGFLGCAQGFSYGYPCGALHSAHDANRFQWVQPGLRTLEIGMDWQAEGISVGLQSDELRITVVLFVAGEGHVLADYSQTPPFELRFDESEWNFSAFDDDETDLLIRVRAPPNTLVYEQPFAVCYTLHHWAEAPPGPATCTSA